MKLRWQVTSAIGWPSALIIFVLAASLTAWSIVWRRHLGRKWGLE
jgi:hypothetical protein